MAPAAAAPSSKVVTVMLRFGMRLTLAAIHDLHRPFSEVECNFLSLQSQESYLLAKAAADQGIERHTSMKVNRNHPAPCQIGQVPPTRHTRYALTNAPTPPRKRIVGTAAARM